MDGRLVKENSMHGANARSAAELEDVPAAVWPVAGENHGGGGPGGFNITDFLRNLILSKIPTNIGDTDPLPILGANTGYLCVMELHCIEFLHSTMCSLFIYKRT